MNVTSATSGYPGQKSSVHVADLPMPSVDQIPNGRGVLVRLLRCGVEAAMRDLAMAEAQHPGWVAGCH